MNAAYLDQFLFAVFPYLALAVFFLMTIYRYRERRFTYSSLSSQFLENQYHFYGMVPFHYGILAVLTGHVVGFLIPRSVLWWNAKPLRLYILEISGLIFALLALYGLVNLIVRRAAFPPLRKVTVPSDWIILALLFVQMGTGIYTALFHPWGSSWFASSLAPYLWSIVKLSPELAYVSAMPWTVKAHILGAFAIIAFFPFTRLVHILVVPNPYFWRKTQVVRWYGGRRKLASALPHETFAKDR
jgi:nitrate reductase gamma subunit